MRKTWIIKYFIGIAVTFFMLPLFTFASVPTSVGINTIQKLPLEDEKYIDWGWSDLGINIDWDGSVTIDANDWYYIDLDAGGATAETLHTNHTESDDDEIANLSSDYRIPTVLPTNLDGFDLWTITSDPVPTSADVRWFNSAGDDYTCTNSPNGDAEEWEFGGESYFVTKLDCPLVDALNEGGLDRIDQIHTASGGTKLYALIYTAGNLYDIATANEFSEYMDVLYGSVSEEGQGQLPTGSNAYGQIDHIVEPTWGTITASSTVDFGFTYTYANAGTVIEGIEVRTWPGPGTIVDTYEENETFASGGSDSLLNIAIDLSAYTGERLMWQAYIKDPDSGQKLMVSTWTIFDVLSTPAGLEPLFPFPISDTDFGGATSTLSGFPAWFSGLPQQILDKHPFAWLVDLYEIFVDLRQDSSLDQPLIELNFSEMDLSSSTEAVLATASMDLVLFSSSTVMSLMPPAVFGALRALITAVLWISLAFMLFARIKNLI